jgi:hypothetical protein
MNKAHCFGLVWATSVLLVPGNLWASMAFPEAIQKELGLAAVPPPDPGCRICHRDDNGMLKTVTKPFGQAMMKQGATATSVPKMLDALRSLDAKGIDSDGDTIPDVDELRQGTNPNARNALPLPPGSGGAPEMPPEGEEEVGSSIPLPETGCTIAVGSVVPTTPVSAAPFALGLVLGAVRRVLRRRRH